MSDNVVQIGTRLAPKKPNLFRVTLTFEAGDPLVFFVFHFGESDTAYNETVLPMLERIGGEAVMFKQIRVTLLDSTVAYG